MESNVREKRKALGQGKPRRSLFKKIGRDVTIEPGVRVFYPENIEIGNSVYIGHDTFLNSYYKGKILIGEGSWIGQMSFLHGAGNITIGNFVGIGPYVKMLTSVHTFDSGEKAAINYPLRFAPIIVEDGCDIGIGSIILPGVTIGKGSIVGAGSVVTKDIPTYEVWAGVPAKKLRRRKIG